MLSRLLRVISKTDSYTFDYFKKDLIAGTTVALILIPQSIAYAQLAGLPAQFGLYAAFLPPIVAVLFGSSRHLATGPVAIISLLTATAIHTLNVTEYQEQVGMIILIALLLGMLQVVIGLFKLGVLVHLLSHPVIYGFVNAAAIIIGFSQLPKIFGIQLPQTEYFWQSVIYFGQALGQGINLYTLSMGIGAFGMLYILRRIHDKLPAILITVVLTTLVAWLVQFEQYGSVIGDIPVGLPMIVFPQLSFSQVMVLFPFVITMAVVGFTETISVAQAIAAKTKQRVDPNRELIGQGLANVAAAFSQGYPVAGSLSRSAVNVRAGAQTGVSMIVASLIVLLTIIVLTPFLYHIPQAVLAVIIIFSVLSLVDIKHIRQVWGTNRADGVAAVVTFATTLLFAPHLDTGIVLGLLFSLGYYFYQNMRPRVSVLSKYKDGLYHDARTFHLDECENIAVLRFEAPLFFANADYLVDEILQEMMDKKHLKYVLLLGDGITQIDATGEQKIEEILELLRTAQKDIYFANLRTPVRKVFEHAGLIEKIGKDHIFGSAKEGIKYLLGHTKHHTDEDHCPLLKYMHLSEDRLQHPRRAENTMLFLRKLHASRLIR